MFAAPNSDRQHDGLQRIGKLIDERFQRHQAPRLFQRFHHRSMHNRGIQAREAVTHNSVNQYARDIGYGDPKVSQDCTSLMQSE